MQREGINIELLRKGDKTAYAMLVRTFQQKIYATCYKFFLNEEDAKDLSQEIFIEIFHSIHDFKEEAQLSTWIFRITSNKCLDELKKRKRKKRIFAIASRIGLDQISHLLFDTLHPEKKLLIKEELKIVLDALDQLNDRQRMAYTLSKIEDYTTKEIAEIMNISISATEALIKRAKENLLQKIKKS